MFYLSGSRAHIVAKMGYKARHCPGIRSVNSRSLKLIILVKPLASLQAESRAKKHLIHLSIQLTDRVPDYSRYSLADARCPLGLRKSPKANN